MIKKLFFLALGLTTFSCAEAQTTPLPYSTGFENVTSWQLIRKGAADPNYKWAMDNFNPYAGTSALYHGYPVGGSQVTDDWYVSPAFSFSSGGKIDSVRHHFSGFGTPQPGDTVAIYLLTGSPDPALATKTLLHDFRGTHYVADNNWNKTTGIVIPAKTGMSYIAFRYYTVANWLDVRFDNLHLNGNTTGIPGTYTAGIDFTIAPNPVRHHLAITTSTTFKWMNMYDATGKIVYHQPFQANADISQLSAGMYFLELSDANNKKGFLSIIKQ